MPNMINPNPSNPCPRLRLKTAKFECGYGSYEGEYYDDFSYRTGYDKCPHGIGKVTDKSGSVIYEGGFVDGHYDGYGWLKTENGEIYEGYFNDGRYHGRGRLVCKDKSVHETIFVNGRAEQGYARHTYANGEAYEGYYYLDGQMRVKEGKMRYNNGGEYSGGWNCDKWSGEGVYRIGTKTYKGIWNGTKYAYKVTMTDGSRVVNFENEEIR